MSEQTAESRLPSSAANTDQGNQQKSTEDGTSEASQVATEESEEAQKKGSDSPEPNCSICLGKLENRSFTDSCFHTFCFTCLLEWSKVKAVCPLCKQPFKSIIHNVRSIEDFDQYLLRSNEDGNGESPDTHRFRYRTTLTTDRWMLRQQRNQSRQLAMLQQPTSVTTRSHWGRMRQHATSEFRRRVYSRGLRVQPPEQVMGRPLRLRNISVDFIRRNQACTHRLVPWLNRELNVLLGNHEDHGVFVLELIMGLIKRFEITDEAFATHLESFLGRRTDHFIHEFLNFARSPYDMCGYDAHAEYRENPSDWLEAVMIDSSSSDSDHDDSDVFIVSPPERDVSEVVGGQEGGDHTYFSLWGAMQDEPQEEHRDNNDPNEPTPLISRVREFLADADVSTPAQTGWDSPIPGPSTWELSEPRVDSPTRLNLGGDVNGENAGKTDLQYESDSDDVMVVEIEKAFGERTPILLSSDEDEIPLELLKAEKEKAEKEKKKREKKLSPTADTKRKHRSSQKSRSRERSRHSRARTNRSRSSSRRRRHSRSGSRSRYNHGRGSYYSSRDCYRSRRSRSRSLGRHQSDRRRKSRSRSTDRLHQRDSRHRPSTYQSARPRAYRSRSRSRSPVRRRRSRSGDNRYRAMSPSRRHRSRSSSSIRYSSQHSHHSFMHSRRRTRSSSVELIDERPARHSRRNQQKRREKRRRRDRDSSSSSSSSTRSSSSSSSGNSSDDIEIINTDSSVERERDRHHYKKHPSGHKRTLQTDRRRHSDDSDRSSRRRSPDQTKSTSRSQYKKHPSGHKGKTGTSCGSGQTRTSSGTLSQSQRATADNRTGASGSTLDGKKSSSSKKNEKESSANYLNVVIKKEPGTEASTDKSSQPTSQSLPNSTAAGGNLATGQCAVSRPAAAIVTQSAECTNTTLPRKHAISLNTVVSTSDAPQIDANTGGNGREKSGGHRKHEHQVQTGIPSSDSEMHRPKTVSSKSTLGKNPSVPKSTKQKEGGSSSTSKQNVSSGSTSNIRKEAGSCKSTSRKEAGSSKTNAPKEAGSCKTSLQREVLCSKTSTKKGTGSSKTSIPKEAVSSKTTTQKEVGNSKTTGSLQKEGGSSKSSKQKEAESSKTIAPEEAGNSKTVVPITARSSKTSLQKEVACSKTSTQKEAGSSKTSTPKGGNSKSSTQKEAKSSKATSQEEASSKSSIQKDARSCKVMSQKETGTSKVNTEEVADKSKRAAQKESGRSKTSIEKEPESVKPGAQKSAGTSKTGTYKASGSSNIKEIDNPKLRMQESSDSSTKRVQEDSGVASSSVLRKCDSTKSKTPKSASGTTKTGTQKESDACRSTTSTETFIRKEPETSITTKKGLNRSNSKMLKTLAQEESASKSAKKDNTCAPNAKNEDGCSEAINGRKEGNSQKAEKQVEGCTRGLHKEASKKVQSNEQSVTMAAATAAPSPSLDCASQCSGPTTSSDVLWASSTDSASGTPRGQEDKGEAALKPSKQVGTQLPANIDSQPTEANLELERLLREKLAKKFHNKSS